MLFRCTVLLFYIWISARILKLFVLLTQVTFELLQFYLISNFIFTKMYFKGKTAVYILDALLYTCSFICSVSWSEKWKFKLISSRLKFRWWPRKYSVYRQFLMKKMLQSRNLNYRYMKYWMSFLCTMTQPPLNVSSTIS